MECDMTCDEILKLIRAMKTYNLAYVRYGSIELHRNNHKTVPPPVKQLEAVDHSEQIEDELSDFEQENLLITDPEAYEKQFANG